MTYRFVGHSMADPTAYRESSELDEWRDRDPIELFKAGVLEDGLMEQSALDEIGAEVDKTIAEAVRFAEDSPEPPPEALYHNVYGPSGGPGAPNDGGAAAEADGSFEADDASD
jgi:pyruvate dehydrogenase E1 component alpha subunit